MARPDVLEAVINTDALHDMVEQFPPGLMLGQENEGLDWVAEQLSSESKSGDDITTSFTDEECSDAVIIRGLDVSMAPDTPDSYPKLDEARLYPFDIAHIAVCIASRLRPFAVTRLRNGCLTTDLFPHQAYLDIPDTGLNAHTPLDWHIDQALDPSSRPDWLSLLAVRNIEQVPTLLAAVDSTDMSQKALDILRAKIFILRKGSVKTSLLPLVKSVDLDGRCILNSAGTGEIDIDSADISESEARESIEELKAVITDPDSKIEVVLNEGEILRFNNQRLVHARSTFKVSEQWSKRRWLRRYYARDECSVK